MKTLIFLVLSNFYVAPSYMWDKSHVPCGCGQSNVRTNARIVNGEDAIPSTWSMMVSVRKRNTSSVHFCGGTILSESYILTAAHCVNDYITGESYGNMSIVAGLHNVSQTNQIMRQVDKIIVHPLWNKLPAEVQYDVALLHLSEPLDLQMNSSLSRVCLPPRQNTSQQITNHPLNGTRLVAIGWGALGFTNERPQILQQVTLYSIHHSVRICSETIRNPLVNLCAGWYNESKTVCFGDSGGPIFQWLGDRWEQVGIASYTENLCGINNYPSVFTRISYFHDWIQSYILNTNQSAASSDNTTANSRKLYQCSIRQECGCSRRNVILSPARFAENENALPFTWSMVVSIRVRSTNEHICSGTILDDTNILTAAHCVRNISEQDLIVAASMYYLSEKNAVIRPIQQIVIHPNYTAHGNQYTNDLAILHLSIPIDRYDSGGISQTCLSRNHTSRQNQSLVIAGWNMTKNYTFINPEIIQQAEVYSIGNHSNCSSINNQYQLQFCAGHFEYLKNHCDKETFGNPIFQWNDFRWIQVGLASYCSMSGQSMVFTNLTQYSTWIKSTMISNTNQISSTVFHCSKKASCGCGKIDVNLTTSGVIDSEAAVESSWPMIVSIQHNNTHHCVGTILSSLFILTSSSCLLSFHTNEIIIIAGTSNLSDTQHNIRRGVSQIYHYEINSTSRLYKHDVAIIKLDQSLPFNGTQSMLSKTCLSNKDNFFLNWNSSLAIIGWNQISKEYNVLQQISMKLIDNNHRSCRLIVFNKTYQFCARPANNNPYLDIRNLDFTAIGVPVMMYVNDHWQQIGIITNESLPPIDSVKVYTRLSPYIDWIKQFVDEEIQTMSSSSIPTSTKLTTNNSIMNYQQSNNAIFNIIFSLIGMLLILKKQY